MINFRNNLILFFLTIASLLISQDVTLELNNIDINNNTFTVSMINSEPIYSFQLTVDGVSLASVEFLQGPWYWMGIGQNLEMGLVMAYTFDTPPIPPGEHDFLQISFEESPDTEVCIVDFIYVNHNGETETQNIACCSYFDFEPYILPGDFNDDGWIDILDVITLVTFILGDEQPSTFEFYVGDINDDQIINVLDIVSLIQIFIDQ
jgi:hypothetical protein